MHPELEALIRAYDAAREAQGPDAAKLRADLEDRQNDALAQHPQLNRETLLNLIRIAHARWVRSQQKPPTLPPNA
jgi:hypothetical protein